MFQFKNFDTSKGNPKTLVVDHGNDFTFMELQHRYENTAAMKDDMPVFNKMEYDVSLRGSGFVQTGRDCASALGGTAELWRCTG